MSLNGKNISVVVPAAGKGDRMKNKTPKQYLKVCGSPLVLHCLRAFNGISWINKVVVVADDSRKMNEVIEPEDLQKIHVIEGKGCRHQSIFQGLQYLSIDAPQIVVIHDGVRPLVPQGILYKVVIGAIEKGAAGAIRPLVSTIVMPDENQMLQSSLIRSLYRNSEMPQAFNYSMILEAYKKCPEEELISGTECLSIALVYGGTPAQLVEGTNDLWKVTVEEDLLMAELCLSKHVHSLAIHFIRFDKPKNNVGTHSNDINLDQQSIPLDDLLDCITEAKSTKSEDLSNHYKIIKLRELIDEKLWSWLSDMSLTFKDHCLNPTVLISLENITNLTFLIVIGQIKTILDLSALTEKLTKLKEVKLVLVIIVIDSNFDYSSATEEMVKEEIQSLNLIDFVTIVYRDSKSHVEQLTELLKMTLGKFGTNLKGHIFYS